MSHRDISQQIIDKWKLPRREGAPQTVVVSDDGNESLRPWPKPAKSKREEIHRKTEAA